MALQLLIRPACIGVAPRTSWRLASACMLGCDTDQIAPEEKGLGPKVSIYLAKDLSCTHITSSRESLSLIAAHT